MKKLMLSMLIISNSPIFALEKLTTSSLRSDLTVGCSTLAATGAAGTLAHFMIGHHDDTPSKVIVALAALGGGVGGWWWSSGRTPEGRFNYAVQMLNSYNTQQLVSILSEGGDLQSVFERAEQLFGGHSYPRVKTVQVLDELCYNLAWASDGLRNAIMTESERTSPNGYLIENARTMIPQLDRYRSIIDRWIPQLKRDQTYLLQHASYQAEEARKAAERAESEATFAHLEASMARMEARQNRAAIQATQRDI